MEISFDTKELRDLCADESSAALLLSQAAAGALKHRISDMRAADSILEVLAGNPRADVHQTLACYVFELSSTASLTVVPAHGTPRVQADGSPDWARIRRVKVVSLKP